MEENFHIQIYPSSIKPIKRKASFTNFHTYQSTNKRIRVLAVPIVETSNLQLQQQPPNKVFGVSRLGRGLVGVLQSKRVGPSGTIDVKMVDGQTVASWIAEGKLPSSDVVVITKSNKIFSYFIPDLSDLALLPSPLKILVRNILRNEGGMDGIGIEHTIPKSIISIIDPPSVLPTCIETCTLVEGDHTISFNSYSNMLKSFVTSRGRQLSVVKHRSTLLTRNEMDGRHIQMAFNIKNEFKSEGGAKYVLWNCRHMAHESFLQNLCMLIELNMPDAIFLTETRVLVEMARLISQDLNAFRICGHSIVGLIKGVVILTFTKFMKFQMTDDGGENHISWNVVHKGSGQ